MCFFRFMVWKSSKSIQRWVSSWKHDFRFASRFGQLDRREIKTCKYITTCTVTNDSHKPVDVLSWQLYLCIPPCYGPSTLSSCRHSCFVHKMRNRYRDTLQLIYAFTLTWISLTSTRIILLHASAENQNVLPDHFYDHFKLSTIFHTLIPIYIYILINRAVQHVPTFTCFQFLVWH